MSTIEHTRTANPRADDADELVVSVVIPCLNEEENIEQCVTAALEAMERAGIEGEVVVADNNSEDRSAELARGAGAHVVTETRRGYGSAYLAGFAAARGKYIVMGDADLTYDFNEIPNFVRELDDGAQLVMGDRMDNIQPGAMHWLNRYVGNPVLSGTLNLFFKTGIRDAHCGMRALRRDVLPQLDLRTTGMEFASEMVIRASKERLDIREFPIQYHPRGGETKLSRVRDGWRHLRFLLVHSPTHLFVWPGAVIGVLGVLLMAMSFSGVEIFGRQWQLHATVVGGLGMIVGVQIISLGLCAHTYGAYFMNEKDPWFDGMRARFRLEHGLLLGLAATMVGVLVAAVILGVWISNGFGSLSEERLAILAATLVTIGLQTIFSSFLLSILGLRRTGS
ncbi:MAG TPA: glycosyltransferase family 2 protein [Baekduia sp.]|nr:glycosyltransferase family 2 protein [Baekduia sp.]